jgi:hypothetical protein
MFLPRRGPGAGSNPGASAARDAVLRMKKTVNTENRKRDMEKSCGEG